MAGVREAKKEDKQRRIHAAAATLFRANGYEATTTRAIAAEAGVAAGTLFLYVRDKDEALALVYGDDVDAALARGTRSRPARLGFVAGVVHRLRPLYALYARHPELALRYLRRIPTMPTTGAGRAEAEAHRARNARFAGVLGDEVTRAVASGELRRDLDVPLATRTLFGVVRILVFHWLADGAGAPAAAATATGSRAARTRGGLRDLEATLRLLVAGLAGPRPGATESRKRGKRGKRGERRE